MWKSRNLYSKPQNKMTADAFISAVIRSFFYRSVLQVICFWQHWLILVNKMSITSKGFLLDTFQPSPSLTVLSLYYRHARAFESSRQEFPCSSLPQQGKRSRKKNNNNQLLLPLLRKSRAGEFSAGTFKCACMMVIKRQDLKTRAG